MMGAMVSFLVANRNDRTKGELCFIDPDFLFRSNRLKCWDTNIAPLMFIITEERNLKKNWNHI